MSAFGTPQAAVERPERGRSADVLLATLLCGILFVSEFTTGPAEAEISALADGRFLNGLAPLPETQVEVFALAQLSGAGKGDVMVGEMATETGIKAASLDQYRLVLFATHGLVTGELSGVDEPGLVLTPPSVPTSTDDGYLGLSEITNLRFNADMIILSACNTAAGDGRSGAPGLSGLARGFLSAGARSVAVTHWSIPSQATLSLNVAWLRAKTASPTSDWADALRQGISDMVLTEGPASFAHPANWGAFEVFGAPS